MVHTYIFVLSLVLICNSGTSNILDNGDAHQRSINGTVQRMSQLGSFLLPLPADEISHVMNETVGRYVPVNSESQLCRQHSLLVLESFHQRHLWALKMIDAGTKLMSGILDGNLYDLGNFEQCINIVHPDRLFNGQLCVVRTAGFINENIQMNLPYPTDVTFSVCVPSSCSVEDVALHFDSVLAQVNASTMYSLVKSSGAKEESLVNFLTCSEKDELSFRLEDYITVILFMTVGILLITCTMFESKFITKSVFSGMSLRNSFQGLMDTKAPTNEISCLNGLRVILLIQVVAYHRLYDIMLYRVIPPIRTLTTEEAYSSVFMRFVDTWTMAVDLFFLMSATVASYTYFIAREKQQHKTFWNNVLMRYFRLTPVLAVMMLFYSTLAVHLSTGPIWSQNSEPTEGRCRKYWWTGLLYISNYYNPSEICVGQSWYVACDFQLYVLSQLFFISFGKMPKLGSVILIAIAAGSIAGLTAKSFIYELYPGSMLTRFLQMDSDANFTDYTEPHFRLPCYVMGIGLGYILFLIKYRNKENTFPKGFFTLGWIASGLLLTIYLIASMIIYHPDHVFKPWFDPLFNGFRRPVLCLAIAWIIFACSLGHGGIVDRFLSWSAFRPLARLGYSAYLVHRIVIFTQLYSVQVPQAFSYKDYVFLVCGDIVISFLLAILLYIAVEVPCYKLAYYLITDKKTGEVQNIAIKQLHPTNPKSSKT